VARRLYVGMESLRDRLCPPRYTLIMGNRRHRVVDDDNNVYYRTVHGFTNRLRVVARSRNTSVLNQNLDTCFRGEVAPWWNDEASSLARDILVHATSMDSWCWVLKERFKQALPSLPPHPPRISFQPAQPTPKNGVAAVAIPSTIQSDAPIAASDASPMTSPVSVPSFPSDPASDPEATAYVAAEDGHQIHDAYRYENLGNEVDAYNTEPSGDDGEENSGIHVNTPPLPPLLVMSSLSPRHGTVTASYTTTSEHPTPMAWTTCPRYVSSPITPWRWQIDPFHPADGHILYF
jgi:hypothetical protein